MKKIIFILLYLPIFSFCQNFGFGQAESKTTYYENEKILSEINYKYGKREGKCIYYWKNGNVLSEVNYKNGKTYGLYKSYYEEGQLKEEGNYNHTEKGDYSRKDGTWKTYYKNGQIKAESTIKNGVPLEWKTYDKDGDLILQKEGGC